MANIRILFISTPCLVCLKKRCYSNLTTSILDAGQTAGFYWPPELISTPGRLPDFRPATAYREGELPAPEMKEIAPCKSVQAGAWKNLTHIKELKGERPYRTALIAR